MITRDLAELIAGLAARIRQLEQRSQLPAGWHWEARSGGPWGVAGLYAVSPQGYATLIARSQPPSS